MKRIGFFLVRVCGSALICLCGGCCSPFRCHIYTYSFMTNETIKECTGRIRIPGYILTADGEQTAQRMREIKICLSAKRVTLSEAANLLNVEQMKMGIPLTDRVLFVARIDNSWYDHDLFREVYPSDPEKAPGPPLVDIEAKDMSLLDVVWQVCRQIPYYLEVWVGVGDMNACFNLIRITQQSE